MAKKKKKKQQANTSDIHYEYNPDDFLYEPDNYDYMPALPITAEKKCFKKLGKDEKTVIKDFIIDTVTTYWHEQRQIPMGESLAAIKKTLTALFLEEYRVMLKDDTELNIYLRDNTLSTINKLLKKEKQE